MDRGSFAVKNPSTFKTLALWAAPVLFLGIFFLNPLSSIFRYSFARSENGILLPFLEAVRSPYLLKILWFTIWQAALSTFFTLLLGLPGAYLFARYQFPGKSLLQALSSVPFVMPTLVVAAAFDALLGPRGWINLLLMSALKLTTPPIEFTYTIGAIMVAHVFYNTTIVLRLVGDFWSHMDPRLRQAAQTLGASPRQALWSTTLPLLMPAILSAALLVFIFDFTSFGVILILGGPRFATLEVEIYYQTISLFNLPLAATLAIVQLGCTLALTILYTRLSRRVSRPLSLRPRSFNQKKLHTWRERLSALIIVVVLVSLLVTPLLALSLRSFMRLDPDRGSQQTRNPGFTLDFYQELSINRRQSLFFAPPSTAMGISLGYALVTVVLSLALGLPAALAQTRSANSPVSRVLEPLFMLPLGTSAVTLGLGFILAFDTPPLNLRASPWLVPLAHTLVAFPFVVRSLAPAFYSIKPRLRQAAQTLGANPLQVFLSVDLPLIARAVLVGATFAFTISLGEFGATALIARPEYPTIPVAIYRLIGQPGAINYGQALALSTILMCVCAGGMLAIEKMRIADIGEF
jgi:thiamine transport system permease protein